MKLRNSGKVPKRFEINNVRQAKMINWMIEDNPSERPSAVELLSNELLPPKMEDDYIKDILKTISNPTSTFYKKIIDAIFKSDNISLDRDSIIETANDFNFTKITNDLVSYMYNRNINEFRTPIFVDPPKQRLKKLLEKTEEEGEYPTMLSKEGILVFLRENLRIGWKKSLQRIDKTWFLNNYFRRFELGEIFKKQFADSIIVSKLVCDYDCICLKKSLHLYNLAESIKIGLEFVEKMEIIVQKIRINHFGLISTFFDYINISGKKTRNSILKLMEEFFTGTITQHGVRTKLVMDYKISEKNVDKIFAFFNIRGGAGSCKKILQNMFMNNQVYL